MELADRYATPCCTDGDLVGYLEKLINAASESDNSGLTYLLFKATVAARAPLNFSNQNPTDIHGYEDLKPN